MDKLRDIPRQILPQVAPTIAVYVPLLQTNAEAIRATKRESYTWGSHPRQALDVYFPSKKAGTSRTPVLLYLYGGGLVRGAKQLDMVADGLAYTNLGHYFAETYRYTTIVADYRVLEHGSVFPSGGEDAAGAVDWICNTLTQRPGYEKIDLFMMGNSAGGIHLSTYLFCSAFERSRKQVITADEHSPVKLRGAIHLSEPFSFHRSDASRSEVLVKYFKNDHQNLSPHALLKAELKSGRRDVIDNVRCLILNGTLDDNDELLDPRTDYLMMWKELDETSYNKAIVEPMEGHNHISPWLALGTGIPQEEAWGKQVAAFCDSLRQ